MNMANQLYQWSLCVNGLFPQYVNVENGVWLKKDQILIKSRADDLYAYVLGDPDNRVESEAMLLAHIHLNTLVSPNHVQVSGGSGNSIDEVSELGTDKSVYFTFKENIPDQLVQEIQDHVPTYLGRISDIADEYLPVVSENKFMQISLDYFYEAGIKSVTSSEGLVSIVTCLEAMFNESPGDIKYKLSLRAAFLLRAYKFDSNETFKNLKKAYDLRSKIVHGASQDKYLKELGDLSNYARCLIKIMLVLLSNNARSSVRAGERKNSLLREIDLTMLNPEDVDPFFDEITCGIKKLNLDVKSKFETSNSDYVTSPW